MFSTDLIPENFNYKNYVSKFSFASLLNANEISSDPSKKIDMPNLRAVDNNQEFDLPIEIDDLCRLHFITTSRKVLNILEFGVGKSSRIFADALLINKNNYMKYTESEIRRKNQYECYSVDNYKKWIDKCKDLFPQELINNKTINFYFSNVITSEFNGRICTFYENLPNVCPDLIYIDGPDQYSPLREVRGISTKHQDRMPMSADILSLEHFLQPGTLVIIDGRSANARFIKSNLQRNWSYHFSEEWDQHFFELLEPPLGKYNKRMIDHCLGNDFYQRLKSSEQFTLN